MCIEKSIVDKRNKKMRKDLELFLFSSGNKLFFSFLLDCFPNISDMTDHCCGGGSSHCHESETVSNTDDNESTTVTSSSNDIHKYLNLNDHDNSNDESQTVSQLFDIAWANQNDVQSLLVDTTTDDSARMNRLKKFQRIIFDIFLSIPISLGYIKQNDRNHRND